MPLKHQLLVTTPERPAPLLHTAVIGRSAGELRLAPDCEVQTSRVQKCASMVTTPATQSHANRSPTRE
jgi:hypothetical protein